MINNHFFSSIFNKTLPYALFRFVKCFLVQLAHMILTLLCLVLWKSLMLGQTRLFSSNRIVFRGERYLPIYWIHLAELKAEPQVSFLTYLLSNPAKIHYTGFYGDEVIAHYRSLQKALDHQPHSDNKLYVGSGTWDFTSSLPWLVTIWSFVTGILVICIILKSLQIIYLVTHRMLFAYIDLANPGLLESRWKLLFEKLNSMCDAIDKRAKESETDQSKSEIDVKLQIETDKGEKND